MRQLIDTTTVTTGDEIASAVMSYAHALVQAGESDLVEIPTVDEGGERGTVQLLLSPATRLMNVPSDSTEREVEDGHTVRQLRERGDLLRPGTAIRGHVTGGHIDDWDLPAA